MLMDSFNSIDVNDIRALMEAYSIPDFDIPDKLNKNLKGKLSKRIAVVLDWGLKGYAQHNNSREELALLIQFLRACKGNDIQLKGIVHKPHGKYSKGLEMTAKLSASSQFITWLELFANTWLEQQQDGLYQYEFDWDFKQPLTICRGLAPVYEKEQDPFFLDPYTDEEISSIIEYEAKSKGAFPQFKGNSELGRMAWKIKTLLEPHELEITQRKLYSFIYDVMLLGKCTGTSEPCTDEGFSGDIGREKAQYIINWLSAYETAVKKHLSRQE